MHNQFDHPADPEGILITPDGRQVRHCDVSEEEFERLFFQAERQRDREIFERLFAPIEPLPASEIDQPAAAN